MKEWLKAKDEGDVAEFYDRKYRQSGKEAFTGYDWGFFFDTVQELFGKPRPTDKWLDCGCGHGEFIEKVIAKYKFSAPALAGIDISGAAVELAKKRFVNYEYEITIKKISMDYIPSYEQEGIFSIVTSWGSIEHAIDPLLSLKMMLGCLDYGGFLMITVPLEFDGCLKGIESEPFKNNNERFMEYKEWYDYFSQVKKPIMTKKIEMIDYDDMFLVFKK